MDAGAHWDRLRATSSELQLKPAELAEAAARTGCCSLVDALLAGPWNWPADAGKAGLPMQEKLTSRCIKNRDASCLDLVTASKDDAPAAGWSAISKLAACMA
jgi:hypothetical protein